MYDRSVSVRGWATSGTPGVMPLSLNFAKMGHYCAVDRISVIIFTLGVKEKM